MSERYWITGVQLGLLIALEKPKREKLVNKMVEEQFIGNKEDLDWMLKDYPKFSNKTGESK